MEILPQIIILSIIASASYILVACGLTLTFGVLEFINFSHGEIAMFGAFTFYAFYNVFALPLIVSLILTIILIALLGIIIERTTFRPVRDKQAFIPLVLSIGVGIILTSIVLMLFGGGSKTYFEAGEITKVYHLFNDKIIITLPQIAIIITSIILITALALFLKYSKNGKAIRAVSDNKEIAATLGINLNKAIRQVFIIGSALAAIAGILMAFDQNLYPRMGLPISIKAFAAIVLGGVGSLKGAILGAVIIAFSENLIIGLTKIPGSYRELIVFVIFVIIILIKPYGLLGSKK